ncbi:probable LRR receptor-like serine/threonine-protein kinase At4g20940 [Phalaenopsis equestris]|uniref:probable LRR receptor-like serine/threonine-protein kinase At4g20940 n=1 Tax=Phalaenopsis equestris TaxID=78828 RepID=UPI0009E42836|nr:probable LRR receptor-like serine/threonine-protein kinase At4g20940 [Phalaenopsis equestris]
MRFFGGTLTLILLLLPVSSQLPSQDIMSLLSFKKGIIHDPTGYISDSWNEESIDFNGCPSSWNGIVCSGENVAGVVLDNLGISGTADLSVFANLTALLKLSMANNNLSGALPGNLGNFKALKYLDISFNLFHGEIPKDFGKLQSIQNLSFAGNNFSGSLPDSIGDIDSVRSLDMSHNHLSGSLPSSLKALKSLLSLNLSFNEFEKGIPTGLDVISSLESIDLSWNKLDGDVDWEFLMQTGAVNIDFSGNSLTSSNSNEMKFLSQVSDSVKYLNLSHNQLTGSLIDGGELSTFGSLRVLDLSYNRLSGPLPGFDYVYDLEILRLGNNDFNGFLPNGLLKGDTLVLNELDLSANNLSGHIGLITSTTLRILNLSSNSITGELPLLTGSCTILDLSKNQISGNLSVTAKWSNDLEHIDLSQNQLRGPIPEVTSQFLRLNFLSISQNSLFGTLPEVLVQYPKITILDLSSNQFSGPMLPDLLSSSSLHELYLQNNLLAGDIKFSPSSPTRPSLQILKLGRNHFSGSFPNDFAFLTGLQLLDISANNFSGNLPPTVTKLISLNSLDVSQNHFTGPLPTTLPNTLIFFNASYNELSGIVPENLRKFPDSSFYPGNSKLVFPGGSPGSGGSLFGSSTRKHMRSFIKAVIIAACIVFFIVFILILVLVRCKRISSISQTERVVVDKNSRRRTTPNTSRGKGSDAGSTLVVSAGDLITPRKESSSEIIGLEEKISAGVGLSPSKNSRISWSPDSGETYIPENLASLDARSPDRLAGDLHFLDETITLTPEELSRAPAEVLGRSSHGTSYRATLDNGLFLTVKWLREGVAKPKKEFTKEAKKFANIRHPNVVGLRGYYWGPTQHEKLILSDYISPGSLSSFLYDRPGRRGPPLTWAQRLKIAVDVARGLNYLHFDRAMPHGNLKTTNILLDGLDLNARVSDYCLHRLMTPAGTTDQIHDSGVLGYCAPELAGSKKPAPSFKSDTYAFGVVLLELLTGRCAGDVVSGEEGGVDLTDWVRLRVAEGRGSDCFDAAMAADTANTAAVRGMKEMLGIALRCIRPVSERPGIKSVYEDLSSI